MEKLVHWTPSYGTFPKVWYYLIYLIQHRFILRVAALVLPACWLSGRSGGAPRIAIQPGRSIGAHRIAIYCKHLPTQPGRSTVLPSPTSGSQRWCSPPNITEDAHWDKGLSMYAIRLEGSLQSLTAGSLLRKSSEGIQLSCDYRV